MTPGDMHESERVIRARSRRQAMDWALALASQEIEATITRTEEHGWALVVRTEDENAASATLRQYQIENRGWHWTPPLPGGELVFHSASAIWAVAMVAAYYFCEVRFPQLEQAGIVVSQDVRAGQWWRLFTAIMLHENLPHLMANLTSGFLLLGLAMARYGTGVGLLAAFLAGAVGNLATVIIDPDHHSLGASGMVMGALGLLATQSWGWWRQWRLGPGLWLRAGGAAALILVLVGFSPGTDVMAHIGGFLAGAIFGAGLSLAPEERLQRGPVNLMALAATVALVLGAWACVR